MRLVILESPYAGDVDANVAYARECLKDSLERGESPLMSHLLYTQVLDDNDPIERTQGMEAGHAWIARADAMVVYGDHGFSPGMTHAMMVARQLGRPVEFRYLYEPTEFVEIKIDGNSA